VYDSRVLVNGAGSTAVSEHGKRLSIQEYAVNRVRNMRRVEVQGKWVVTPRIVGPKLIAAFIYQSNLPCVRREMHRCQPRYMATVLMDNHGGCHHNSVVATPKNALELVGLAPTILAVSSNLSHKRLRNGCVILQHIPLSRSPTKSSENIMALGVSIRWGATPPKRRGKAPPE
jgi:hypothetical protein